MCVLLRSGCCAIAAALLLSSLLHTSCCLSVPILISTTKKKESNVFCIHDGFCIFVSCMLPSFYRPCFPLIFRVSHAMRVHNSFVRQPFFWSCPLNRISVATLCIVDLSPFSCWRASFAVGFHGPWFFKQCFILLMCHLLLTTHLLLILLLYLLSMQCLPLMCHLFVILFGDSTGFEDSSCYDDTLKTRIWIIIFFSITLLLM